MTNLAVVKTIREMPQVAERLAGDMVMVTCRIGPQPLYRYQFPMASLPDDEAERAAFIRQHIQAVNPHFFSSFGPLADRCVGAQETAILKLRFKETG